MRFKGELSQIRCFAHILNLVVVDILEAFGPSNNKIATEFLDRASKAKWNPITLLSAAGVIAILRIQVL
jgi:hypothetical protein